MKAKDATELLKGFAGETLYKEASELYRSEVDSLITLRSHGGKPTSGLIDSAINQVNDWFTKVCRGLDFSDPVSPKSIIDWERGEIWVKHGITDPRIEEWQKRTQSAALRGEPSPVLAAMRPGDIEAVSSMMLANMRKELGGWQKQKDKVKEFCEKVLKKRQCPYGADEKSCSFSETYAMVQPPALPKNSDDLAFVCTANTCVKEKKGGK